MQAFTKLTGIAAPLPKEMGKAWCHIAYIFTCKIGDSAAKFQSL